MKEDRIRQGFFWGGLIAITLPLLSGAGLLSGRERLSLAILSLSLFIFFLFKLKGLLHFTLFLSLFISVFLSSQFIFFEKLDPFFFQVVILIVLLLQKKNWDFDNFSLGIICLVIVTFLLQFFVNRVLLGFYLNFWIDVKRNSPVFLFCLTYFITKKSLPANRLRNWTGYFIGLFIFTAFFSYFNAVSEKGIVRRKIEHNLAFFYKDRENWEDMRSSSRRGLVYEYLGLWSKARNEFKKILIISSEDIDAHFNLAQSYAAEKLWYEAALEYERVMELDPHYGGSHYGLAAAYEALGKIDKAKEQFLKEIEINPEEIRAYIALEELYKREGMVKEIDEIRYRRLEKITTSIDEKDIGDDNLRILPVVLNGGLVTVEIIARGTYAQGFWPRMEVWMSAAGRLVRGRDAWVKSSTWKSYYFHFNTLPGEEKIILHFMNDFYGGPENDRNLYIKRINFIYGQ